MKSDLLSKRIMEVQRKVLAVLREEYKGETQAFIAESAGCDLSSVNRLFTGKAVLSFAMLVRLCDAKRLDFAKVWESAEIETAGGK